MNGSTNIFNVNSAFLKPVAIEIISSSQRKHNPLRSMTLLIASTYKQCNSSFKVVNNLPRRILTQPSEGVLNDGCDNEDSNLICRVHDVLEYQHFKYTILDLLGTGTFGQVFRCQCDGSDEVVAVKIIKNKPAYHVQGQLEAKIANLLNLKYDSRNERHIVRFQTSFICKGHLCLVFELLNMSLLDVLTQNQFRGLPLSVVQRFTKQILAALVTFQEAEVIHCDLKPENILLSLSSTPAGALAGAESDASIVKNLSQLSLSSHSDEAVATPLGSSTSSQHTNNLRLHRISSNTQLASVPEHPELSGKDSGPNKNMVVSASLSSSHTSLPSEATTDAAGGLAVSSLLADGEVKPKGQSPAAAAGTRFDREDSAEPGSRKPNALWSNIKVIDLGSACFEGQTTYTYIQSRFCTYSAVSCTPYSCNLYDL